MSYGMSGHDEELTAEGGSSELTAEGGSSELTAEGGHGAVPTRGVPTGHSVGDGTPPVLTRREWPLWEVFVRARRGLSHNHVGSLHAPDADMALRNARDLYTRRQEGVSLWVVRSEDITASSPTERDSFFDPAADKVYRHPTFYDVPADVEYL
jgi:ring-1,2-phenylacetyl-CoA epoxidase subunit PaaB